MTSAPKPRSPAQLRAAEKRRQAKADALVYAAVTRRDSRSNAYDTWPACRVCGWPGDHHPLERHHIRMRSGGGETSTANVCLLCHLCHTWVHGQTLRVSGDADGRMAESGELCGLKIERKSEGRWRSEGYR